MILASLLNPDGRIRFICDDLVVQLGNIELYAPFKWMADHLHRHSLESDMFDCLLRYLFLRKNLGYSFDEGRSYDFRDVFQKLCEDLPWEDFPDGLRENILTDIGNLYVAPEPVDAQIDRVGSELAALKARVTSEHNITRYELEAQKEYVERLERAFEEKDNELRASEKARTNLEQWKREKQDICKKLSGPSG
jgi:hypothetical protein